jgi:IclR family pca regulon transcriptional regulator
MRAKLLESVERTFKILEAFSSEAPRMSMQQISQKVGLPKVTAFRYLRTFVSLGYVAFDPEVKKYHLTPRAMLLGFTALASIDLREVALPYMQELSRQTNQNVNLGIWDRTEVVYIECIKSRRAMRVANYVGTRLNMYRTSIGLVLLAFMEKADATSVAEEILEERDAQIYLGKGGEKLWPRLETVRANGYALNNEEFIPGSRGIAVPVFDGRGSLEAAINMAVFSSEVGLEDLLTDYLPALRDTAKKISQARGWGDHP